MIKKLRTGVILAATIVLPVYLTGCQSETDSAEQATSQATTQDMQQTQNEPVGEPREQVQLELSISDRELRVYRGSDTTRTYPIAVGSEKYPTPTGEFTITQIDWNPDWRPPESEWTEGEEYTPPGHPDNPMGRVRMVYNSPYSLHGTEDLNSLGEAESHGSVRLANEDAIELAKLLMEEGGAGQPESWYEQVLSNPKKMESVELRVPIQLTNKP